MAQSILYKKGKESPDAGSRGMGVFMIIWLGQIVSLIGSGMTCFAQSVWVYTDVAGTITHLMLLAVAAQLPGILVSPLAGTLVDRWDRRWVMIISDSVAALATMTLRLLIVTDLYQIWHIYVIVIVISIANHFQWPAYFATISLLVPRKNLGHANGLVEMGRSLGQIAAPFMAGMAVATFKIQGVILFDFVTYLFAMGTLLVVRIPKPQVTVVSKAGRGSLLQETLHGWKYLIARQGMLGLLLIFSASNFLLGTLGILLIPLALSVTTASVLGSVMSIGGFSMLVGSLLMSIWGGPKRRVYGVLGFMLVQGLAVVIGGLRPSIPLFFSAAMIFFFASPIVNACSQAIWQSKVPPDMQGRALAASGMIATAALELGYLSAGPLADRVFEPLMAAGGPLAGSVGRIIGTGSGRGIGLMFIISGALCVLVTLAGFLNPRIRLLDTEVPDVEIGGVPFTTEKPAMRLRSAGDASLLS